MLSVRAIYDGKELKLLEEVKITEPKEVIVTFLEVGKEDITAEEIQVVAERGKAFDFLEEEEEDVYTDEDLKIKYK